MNKVFGLIKYSIIAASSKQQTIKKLEYYKTHTSIIPDAT